MVRFRDQREGKGKNSHLKLPKPFPELDVGAIRLGDERRPRPAP